MLMVLLFSVPLFLAQDASLDCSNAATTQTQAIRGPAGETALVKASTHDDASKDSHDCMADYELIVHPANGGPPVATEFLSSDGDWGRKISPTWMAFHRMANESSERSWKAATHPAPWSLTTMRLASR